MAVVAGGVWMKASGPPNQSAVLMLTTRRAGSQWDRRGCSRRSIVAYGLLNCFHTAPSGIGVTALVGGEGRIMGGLLEFEVAQVEGDEGRWGGRGGGEEGRVVGVESRVVG